MSNVVEITDQNFEDEVMSSDRPVFLDFWAEWCGPCKMIAPAVTQLADDFEGRAKIGKVNIDNHPGLQQKYNIMTIPTLMVIKDGQVIEQVSGLRTKDFLEEMINKSIDG